MTGTDKLRFDPFRVFKGSKSPAGLYARQKWFHEADTTAWKRDFQETVSKLLKGQGSDGSWEQSALQTIRHLFGLHLTVRDPNPAILRGLEWLMGRVSSGSPHVNKTLREDIRKVSLEGLPFTRGRYDLFVCGATLFLSSIFGRENDPDVLNVYNWLALDVFQKDGRWGGWSSSNNILRAFVVHPRFSLEPKSKRPFSLWGVSQDAYGKWRGHIPFFQTVNALAHLDSIDVDAQLALAFKRLHEIQNGDGTWGRTDREWKTFLTIHALKNRGRLKVVPDSGNTQIH